MLGDRRRRLRRRHGGRRRATSRHATTGSSSIGTGESSDDLAEGRRRGRDLLAFRRGRARAAAPVDVFVKVDADTSFEPRLLRAAARALRRAARPRDRRRRAATSSTTAAGSGSRSPDSHPRGASRAYRWALLDEVVEALEPELGWDGVDEVMAELRGYRTAGFQDIGFRHHRKVGEREGRLRAGAALGPAGLVHGLPAELPDAARGLPGARELRRRSRWSGATRRRPSAARRSARIRRVTRPDPGGPAAARGGAARRLDVASLRGA